MASSTLQRGIVKSVQSGDSIVVRGQPKGGPPPEKQINLAYLIAPKISRKMPDGTYTVDEPFAWDAREFLRKKLVGKEVAFRIEYKLPFGGSQRECAIVFVNGTENVNESLASAGLVEVVKRAQNKDNPDVIRLTELEDAAKSAAIGRWSSGGGAGGTRRILLHEIENGQALVGKSFDAIVEHVRDGSTLRVGFFLPSDSSLPPAAAVEANTGNEIHYQMTTFQLSGVRTPQASEPFGEEARFFTETRLLQRDVRVRLEQFNTTGLSNSFTGTITFLERDIAEYLVREGYAKIVDWTLGLTADPKKLRTLEREAKAKHLRLWKDLKDAPTPTSGGAVSSGGPFAKTPGNGATFDAKVLEIANADALVVQNLETKAISKIFLASIRPPRAEQPKGENGEPLPAPAAPAPGEKRQFRPLYDIPFMFEAREFLRKKLIGKTVKVKIDYIQPKTDTFAEKVCTTVTGTDGQNVAEQLIIKGLVTVVKYRMDDDQRATDYDSFLAAELKAQKMQKGLYSNKQDAGMVRIVDLSTDLTKSKSFAPFLTRSTGLRKDAVVEYVFPSSTKVKLYIPKENCLINLVLGGVNTPKQNDPIAAESVQFAKSKILQRDVHVEIETQDKVGNYIGSIYYEKNHNLAAELVRAGFLTVREYNTKNELIVAETEAKAARKGIWKDWQPEEASLTAGNGGDAGTNLGGDFEDGAEDGAAASATDGAALSSGVTGNAAGSTATSTPASAAIDDLAGRRKVVITNLSATFTTFHAQDVADGPKIEDLLTRLREEAARNPPLPGYKPKKGELAMARFSEDKQWYRVKIDKPVSGTESQVLYIDYGNREVLPNTSIAPLPAGQAFSAAAPGAREYQFAFVFPDTDTDFVDDLRREFFAETEGKVLLLKTEYRSPDSNMEAATIVDAATKKDIVLELVREGWLFVDTKTRRTGRLFKKWVEYKDAQEAAKKKWINLWQYGDVTPDDAKEFGYPVRA